MRAEVREECAKVADVEMVAANEASKLTAYGSSAYYAENHRFHAAARIAAAIRATSAAPQEPAQPRG